jgi:hypothetical protein
MQRIGRINRIGSKAKKIMVFNFKPEPRSNSQIWLNETALMKLQSFHTSFGEETKIYTDLEQLEENVLNKVSTTVSETDIRLEYLNFLREFKTKYPTEFERIKALPMRSSVHRTSPDNTEATIAYLRLKGKESFLLKQQQQISEITFEEAIQWLKAEPNEKPLTPDFIKYEQHLAEIVKKFEYNANQNNDDSYRDRSQKNEKIVLSTLKTFIRATKDEERKDLETIANMVIQGIFKNLTDELAAIINHTKSQKEVYKKIKDTAHKYNIKAFKIMEDLRFQQKKNDKRHTGEVVIGMYFKK